MDKATSMPVQALQAVDPRRALAGEPPSFADPDWRGQSDERADDIALHPLNRIEQRLQMLAAWIAGGAAYGWLGVYQSRRAGFELQSIRAHIRHELARHRGALPDDDRRAVQSRLDRLEQGLDAARLGAGVV